MHLYFTNESPKSIGELFTKNEQVHRYETRHRSNPSLTQSKFDVSSKSFLLCGA